MSSVRLLLVDNYDSFTYNLVQALAGLGAEVEVVRNDTASVAELAARGASGLVLSAGPGRPEEAGITVEAVRVFGRLGVPILGVCLGHQAIATAWGGRLSRAAAPMHGKLSDIGHDGAGLFAGLPLPFAATRYHSLVVDPAGLPPELEVSAWTPDGEIMGLRHRSLPMDGVQFHPESVMTAHGLRLFENFTRRCARGNR